MIGPAFTEAEAAFLLSRVTDAAFTQRPPDGSRDVAFGVLIAKLIELKKQAKAMHEGRLRYLEVLNSEDICHGR